MSRYGVRSLVSIFVAWKAVLLLIACASPSPGYDTSTQLLFTDYPRTEPPSWISKVIEHAVLRLTRWDGVYFATLAERGHVNEQDWAFSWVLARVNDGLSRALFLQSSLPPIVIRALVGVVISLISHLLAVLVLYQLTAQLLPPSSGSSKTRIAFTAACLHVFSPAGLFLSAPYGESTFAFFNFTGMLCYATSLHARITSPSILRVRELLLLLTSGISFGLASTIRSNGLLSGIIFAWDAFEALLRPTALLRDTRERCRFIATGIAGALVALGFSLPQLVAYLEYCTDGRTRPWCERMPPSIYSWVQDHYWGVGFLRYWTLSNLPLFLIAAPVLGLLIWTSGVCLWKPRGLMAAIVAVDTTPQARREKSKERETDSKVGIHILRRLALPQLVLAVMAATSFHIQIINRISSGYPLWYISLAVAIHSPNSTAEQQPIRAKDDKATSNGQLKRGQRDRNVVESSSFNAGAFGEKNLQLIVRGMMMYAIVQGGLYASFLPPA